MKNITYRIIIEQDENNTYHAYMPALPGCHTWGESIEETRENVRDAMGVYIKSLLVDGEKIPEDRRFESFETII